jgi:hypothetical protein
MARKIPADAFECYVRMGDSRSYEAVARRYGVSKRAVTKRAARELWQEKLASLESKHGTRLQLLRDIQENALKALAVHPFTNAMDAVRALEIGITLEPRLLAEPNRPVTASVPAVDVRHKR